jgi:hypothetical protein
MDRSASSGYQRQNPSIAGHCSPREACPQVRFNEGLGSESRRRFYSRAGDVSCIRGLSSLRAKNLVQSGKVGETEGIATPRLAPTQTAVYSNL